jgi:hypothetical protein
VITPFAATQQPLTTIHHYQDDRDSCGHPEILTRTERSTAAVLARSRFMCAVSAGCRRCVVQVPHPHTAVVPFGVGELDDAVAAGQKPRHMRTLIEPLSVNGDSTRTQADDRIRQNADVDDRPVMHAIDQGWGLGPLSWTPRLRLVRYCYWVAQDVPSVRHPRRN